MKDSWCSTRTALIIALTTLYLLCICVHTKPINTNREDHSTHHLTVGVKSAQLSDIKNTKNLRGIRKRKSDNSDEESNLEGSDTDNSGILTTSSTSQPTRRTFPTKSATNGDRSSTEDKSSKEDSTETGTPSLRQEIFTQAHKRLEPSTRPNSNYNKHRSATVTPPTWSGPLPWMQRPGIHNRSSDYTGEEPTQDESSPANSRIPTTSSTSQPSRSTILTKSTTNDDDDNDCSSTEDNTTDGEDALVSGRPSLRLVRGRYEAVVVHIDENVAEDSLLVQNIKEQFKTAQKSLEQSTRLNDNDKGLRFGTVTVTVPSTWNYHLPWLQTSLAPPSVLVAPSNPQHGHVPYTVQAGGCGEGGMHIHFTPDYIRSKSDPTVMKMIGAPAAVLVHEWAHFRWGVFDEYVEKEVDKRGPLVKPFYLDDNMQIKPSACPSHLSGWIVKTRTSQVPTNAAATSDAPAAANTASPRTSSANVFDSHDSISNTSSAPLLQQCLTTTNEGLPPPECFFYPDGNQSITVSRMSYAAGNLKKRFCGRGEVSHNSAAPTPHNIQCGGRSVWDVMLEHPDFAGRSCGQTKQECRGNKNEIKFQVFKRPRPRFVLVIVQCKTLVTENFESVKQDIIRFQHSFLPASLQLFAVTSNSLNPRPVSDANQLNCDEGGNNAALAATAKVLNSSVPLTSFGSVVVVSSAGNPREHDTFRHNVASYNRTAAARPTAVTAVSVNTPCPEAHPGFTCVEHRPARAEADMSDDLRTAFRAYDQNDGLQLVSTERHSLWSAIPPMGSEANVTAKFFVNFCSGDALLVVLAGKSSNLTVTLKRDGTSPAPPAYTTRVFKDNHKDVTVVKISCDTGYGDWQYVLTYRQQNRTTDPAEDTNIQHAIVKFYQELDKKIALSIDTRIFVKKVMDNCNKTKKDQSQLTTTSTETETHSTPSYNSQPTLGPQPTHNRKRRHTHVDAAARKVTYDSSVRIVARLVQGETQQDPVLGANVTAVISREENTSASIPLHDSGIGADIVADDGVYSGFLTGLTGNGLYHVTVEASSGAAARRVVHTNDHTFWVDPQQTTSRNFSSDLYLVKVKCFSNNPGNKLRLMFAKEDANSTTFLTELEETYDDRSSQKHFTGRVKIPSSGKLVVPKACIVETVSKDSSPPSQPSSAHGSGILVLPPINDPVGLFKSNSTTNFSLNTDDKANDDANANKNSRSARAIQRIDEQLELTLDANEFNVIKPIDSFELVSYSSRDLTPPSRVRDLVVTDVHYLQPSVVLQWTSPGDDYFNGTAASVELRYHRHQSALQQQFSRAPAVLEGTHVNKEALRPVSGGTQQQLTVRLTDYSLDTMDTDIAVYFALRVHDEASNVGGLSNIAEAHFSLTARDKRLQARNSRLHVAVPILGAVVLVVLATVVIIKLKHRRRNAKKAQFYEGTLELSGAIPSFLMGINSKNKQNLRERLGHSPQVLHVTKSADGCGQKNKHQDHKNKQFTGYETYPRKGEPSTAKHDQMSPSYMQLCEIPLNSNLSEHS